MLGVVFAFYIILVIALAYNYSRKRQAQKELTAQRAFIGD